MPWLGMSLFSFMSNELDGLFQCGNSCPIVLGNCLDIVWFFSPLLFLVDCLFVGGGSLITQLFNLLGQFFNFLSFFLSYFPAFLIFPQLSFSPSIEFVFLTFYFSFSRVPFCFEIFSCLHGLILSFC